MIHFRVSLKWQLEELQSIALLYVGCCLGTSPVTHGGFPEMFKETFKPSSWSFITPKHQYSGLKLVTAVI